jgi:hypothetical protein
VQVHVDPENTIFSFAFDAKRRLLLPADGAASGTFPSMGPCVAIDPWTRAK